MSARYHMPAEWHAQEAIWLAWPHQEKDWPGKFEPIPLVYCEIIRHIAATQTVQLLVKNQAMQDAALELLTQTHANLESIHFHHIPTNRVWLRDSGPTFVRSVQGKPTLLNWTFNAWAKYDDWQLDNTVPTKIAELSGADIMQPTYQGKPVVLEGGAIDVNGAGLMLTTKECLLDPAVQVRNPGFSAADYEAIFSDHFAVDEVIWLDQGIVGDDTHGHVDDLSRFVSETKVVTVVETNKADENYQPLQENKATLEAYRTKQGKALEVIELPMPAPLYCEGERLPASYANFLICNEVVLVPTFNDPNDRIALNILSECFPTRSIIGIHAVDLVWGFGTLHCLSQQQPRFSQ